MELSLPNARVPKSRVRLSAQDRREQILANAASFFSERGLGGQTRELAKACGVSQRLLYKVFPSKANLIREVYAAVVFSPFRLSWAIALTDRSRPIDVRLLEFYREYMATVFTRRWTRLFFYGALARTAEDAEPGVPEDYYFPILLQLIETIGRESCAATATAEPVDSNDAQQIGWLLHGLVSHAALRRQVFGLAPLMPADAELALIVRFFLAGLPACRADAASPVRRRATPRAPARRRAATA